MHPLPTGTVTFLFTEIEDSTRLLMDLGQAEYVRHLGDHDRVIREAIENADGIVIKPDGGAFFAVFNTASDAIRAAVAAQHGLDASGLDNAGLAVRIGIHTGIGEVLSGDYAGLDVHRAARVAAAAAGGQVLITEVTARMLTGSLPAGVAIRDLGEHDLKDFDAQRLYQIDIEGLRSEFAPLQSQEHRPSNLPAALSSFVGRASELDEVAFLISQARFVTIAGVAGAGKTRLAIEIAAQVADEYLDGVWFIDLSHVDEPSALLAHIASVMGIREKPGAGVKRTLVEYLAGRVVLLVIDNCEHLISAVAPFVNDVLVAAPNCKIVATSRELLRVPGEAAFRLQSLSFPAASVAGELSDLEGFDAIRLFVERAKAVQPMFALTGENVSAVVDICRRLDGMPLAIELAAAQVRTASPRQIADRLDRQFQTAGSGMHAPSVRQQTLSAAIDWSYQLLEDGEKHVFGLLSVFRGEFSFEAAQAVVASEDIGDVDLLLTLSRLADKSLMTVDVSGEAARYRLLDMIRQFAGQRLLETGNRDVARNRHAAFFVALAEAVEPEIRGADERAVRARIAADVNNFAAAATWLLESHQPELAMRIAGALWRFGWSTFQFTAGVRWLSKVADAGHDVTPVTRAKVLVGLGTMMGYTDDPSAARPVLEEAIAIYEAAQLKGATAAVLRAGYPAAILSLGTNIWQHEQDFDRAVALWERALDTARRFGDTATESASLGNLAEAAARRGDVDAARSGFAASIAASEALGSAHRTAQATLLSAMFELSVDEPGRAKRQLDDAIAVADKGDLPFWSDFARAMRSLAQHDLGEERAFDDFVRASRRLVSNTDFQSGVYYQLPVLLGRAVFDGAQGDFESAARLLGALAQLEEHNSPLEQIFEGSRRQRLEDVLMSELGADRLAIAKRRGRGLSRSGIIEHLETGHSFK